MEIKVSLYNLGIDVLSHLNVSYILISHESNFLYELTDSIYTMKTGKFFQMKKQTGIFILILI